MRVPLVAAVGTALVFVGCSTTPVKLYNAKTGQTTQCGPYTNMHPLFPGASPHWKAERDCIADFQRQGFERVPE